MLFVCPKWTVQYFTDTVHEKETPVVLYFICLGSVHINRINWDRFHDSSTLKTIQKLLWNKYVVSDEFVLIEVNLSWQVYKCCNLLLSSRRELSHRSWNPHWDPFLYPSLVLQGMTSSNQMIQIMLPDMVKNRAQLIYTSWILWLL